MLSVVLKLLNNTSVVMVWMLQLNEDDSDNLADDGSTDDACRQPADKVSASPVKSKKKRKKKTKDKSCNDAKAVVFILWYPCA